MGAKVITSPCSTSSIYVLAFVLTFLLFISNRQRSFAATTNTETSSNNYKNYLKAACDSATYPQLCYKSLCSYSSTIQTNDLRLCSTALTVALKAVANTSSIVTSLSKKKGLSKSEAAVVKDCLEEIGGSIDELKQSVKALGCLKSSTDVQFQISNIKTWVSAAITNENTCTDGFDGRKVSAAVQSKIGNSMMNVARLTSNALALINRLNY